MSNHNTPLTFRIKEEPKPEHNELPAWENQKCPDHPQFKIDAICVNEDKKELRLSCIKCIIEDKTYSAANGNKLLCLKELIQKCIDTLVSQGDKQQKSRDGLQDRFLNFLTKDYIAIYEQHVETQYKQVESEIQDLINNLTLLRDKFRDHFSYEVEDLRKKGEIIRAKIKEFLDQNPETDQPKISSINDIHEKLMRINTREDLHLVMRELYLRSKEDYIDDSDFQDATSTLQMMNEIKDRCTTIKDREINLSPIECTTLIFP
jgi:hypothetical protein